MNTSLLTPNLESSMQTPDHTPSHRSGTQSERKSTARFVFVVAPCVSPLSNVCVFAELACGRRVSKAPRQRPAPNFFRRLERADSN